MEEIDYKGISEQLMYENERLRKRLVQRISNRYVLNWNSIFNWIERHAHLIILACIVFGTSIAVWDAIQGKVYNG